MKTKSSFDFDVCLSFAGEQREYVDSAAKYLKESGVRVFYDDFERVELWGKDLYQYLSSVYSEKCRFCVIFASKEFANKVWATHELANAQARALQEQSEEYILPARFDGTAIPGLRHTIGYISLDEVSPEELSEMIIEKVKKGRSEYFPVELDRLFDRLDVAGESNEKKEDVQTVAYHFFDYLRRMNEDERLAVISLFRFGCPGEMPENIHIHTDLLQRYTGFSLERLKTILDGIDSLGFTCSIRFIEHSSQGDDRRVSDGHHAFVLEWCDLRRVNTIIPEMLVASAVVDEVTSHYCEQHARETLERLDFSQLSSVDISRRKSGKSDRREVTEEEPDE